MRVIAPSSSATMATTTARRLLRAAQSLAVQYRRGSTSCQSWSVGKVNHIAVACQNLQKATAFYRDILHAKVSKEKELPDQGMKLAFVELGDTKIELLEPLGKDSPIKNFLEKHSCGGIHHICLEVSDIKSAIEELKCKKIRLLTDKPFEGAHGKLVIFLHPKDCSGVLVELEEA